MMWLVRSHGLASRTALFSSRSVRTSATHKFVAPPEGLQIKVMPGKNPDPIRISWWEPRHISQQCQYNVCVSFYHPKCLVEPFKVIPRLTGPVKHPNVEGLHAYAVDHPYSGLQADIYPAFIMQVIVTAQVGEVVSEESRKMVTMDSVLLSPGQDWKKNAELLQDPINKFRYNKGEKFRAAIVGPQHHGKSSFVNHLLRCLRQNTNIADEMETAPSSPAETTVVVKTVTECFGSLDFVLRDVPAISNFVVDSNKQAFDALLMGSIPDGTRRSQFTKFALGEPPHIVFVVISLVHWRDQKDEMHAYLSEMQNRLKCASHGLVAFPYVIVATHRDVFLEECHDVDPYECLGKAIDGIKSSANTNCVFAVTNYEENSPCSSEVNETTYRLLRQALVLSQNTDTAVLQNSWRHILYHTFFT